MDYKYKLDYPMIAKKIRAARRDAQITQAELAERINISTNAVAKLETNLMNISLQTLINIANVLNIDINYLLSDQTGQKHSEKNTDIYFDSVIQNLSVHDKAFIIHIIQGLKEYQSHNRNSSS